MLDPALSSALVRLLIAIALIWLWEKLLSVIPVRNADIKKTIEAIGIALIVLWALFGYSFLPVR